MVACCEKFPNILRTTFLRTHCSTRVSGHFYANSRELSLLLQQWVRTKREYRRSGRNATFVLASITQPIVHF